MYIICELTNNTGIKTSLKWTALFGII